MNYAEICIIKRDGKREDFSISKIKNAIGKAFHASGIDNEDKLIAEITMRLSAILYLQPSVWKRFRIW